MKHIASSSSLYQQENLCYNNHSNINEFVKFNPEHRPTLKPTYRNFDENGHRIDGSPQDHLMRSRVTPLVTPEKQVVNIDLGVPRYSVDPITGYIIDNYKGHEGLTHNIQDHLKKSIFLNGLDREEVLKRQKKSVKKTKINMIYPDLIFRKFVFGQQELRPISFDEEVRLEHYLGRIARKVVEFIHKYYNFRFSIKAKILQFHRSVHHTYDYLTFISAAKIAEKLKCSSRQVEKVISKLRSFGIITTEKEDPKRGKHTNRYCLNMDNMEKKLTELVLSDKNHSVDNYNKIVSKVIHKNYKSEFGIIYSKEVKGYTNINNDFSLFESDSVSSVEVLPTEPSSNENRNTNSLPTRVEPVASIKSSSPLTGLSNWLYSTSSYENNGKYNKIYLNSYIHIKRLSMALPPALLGNNPMQGGMMPQGGEYGAQDTEMGEDNSLTEPLLAHFSLDELEEIDEAMGGPNFDPETGLRDLRPFGEILQIPELQDTFSELENEFRNEEQGDQMSHPMMEMAEGGQVDIPGRPILPELEEIRQMGQGGDTELAIISPFLLDKFVSLGGGTIDDYINPEDGLPQFIKLGGARWMVNPFSNKGARDRRKTFNTGPLKYVKKVGNVVAPLVGGYFGGPIGAAGASHAWGKITGSNNKDALKKGAISGISAWGLGRLFGGGSGGQFLGKSAGVNQGGWSNLFGNNTPGGNNAFSLGSLFGNGANTSVAGGGTNTSTAGGGGFLDKLKGLFGGSGNQMGGATRMHTGTPLANLPSYSGGNTSVAPGGGGFLSNLMGNFGNMGNLAPLAIFGGMSLKGSHDEQKAQNKKDKQLKEWYEKEREQEGLDDAEFNFYNGKDDSEFNYYHPQKKAGGGVLMDRFINAGKVKGKPHPLGTMISPQMAEQLNWKPREEGKQSTPKEKPFELGQLMSQEQLERIAQERNKKKQGDVIEKSKDSMSDSSRKRSEENANRYAIKRSLNPKPISDFDLKHGRYHPYFLYEKEGGAITGPGKGQDDKIPKQLANNSFIIPADVVSDLGDGSTMAGVRELERHFGSHCKKFSKGGKVNALLSDGEFQVPPQAVASIGRGSYEKGSKVLDKFIKDVRASKRGKGNKLPPKAKSVGGYLSQSMKRK